MKLRYLKAVTLFILILILTLAVCACREGQINETTAQGTSRTTENTRPDITTSSVPSSTSVIKETTSVTSLISDTTEVTSTEVTHETTGAEPEYTFPCGLYAGENEITDIIISDIGQNRAAKLLQQAIYERFGKMLEITQASEGGCAICFSDNKTVSGFELISNGESLIVSTDTDSGELRGIKYFIKEVLSKTRGDLVLKPGYKYTKDIDKYVYYSEFEAVGDGVTDDFNALMFTHTYANRCGIPVFADENAVYYIGKSSFGRTVTVSTDVNFGNATFIIDDTYVTTSNRSFAVFNVASTKKMYTLNNIPILNTESTFAKITLPEQSLVYILNKNSKQFIRSGVNSSTGDPMQEVIIVDKDGSIDPSTPVTWNYKDITGVEIYPIDETPLNISGGIFITKANTAESAYTYYSRGISVNRSNVIITGLKHLVEGEGEHGAPYNGFIYIYKCCNVTLSGCIMTPHLTYITSKSGSDVTMGTYDINSNLSVNIRLLNITQTISINDNRYWGIFTSNYSRNIEFDSCILSRFDAHKGVYNATIRNCELGHQGINAIGFGTLLCENTTVSSSRFINMRSDYGSTWRGDFIIKNCTFKPNGDTGANSNTTFINCLNTEKHNFGYECFMPENIIIDGLTVDDTVHSVNYSSYYLLGNYNSSKKNDSFKADYPYREPVNIEISGLVSLSGAKWILCKNQFLYKNVSVTEK